MDHRLDRAAHENRRVVDDIVVEPFRKIFLQLLHRRTNRVGRRNSIGAGQLRDRNGHGGLVIEERPQRIRGRAELDARDVAQTNAFAVLAALHNDIAKLFFRRKTPLGVDEKLCIHRIRYRLLTHATGGDLDVLLADRGDDIGGG